MLDIIIISSALLASLVGLFALWTAWKHGTAMRSRLACAVLLWSLSTAVWIWRFGAEIGIPLALETTALVAFGFILSRMERRADRPLRTREVRQVAPVVHSRPYGLGALRVLVAGPLGLAAAMGIAVAMATRLPSAEQTRLILAGLIVPTLWAIGVGWVVCQRRLAVQAASFITLGMAGISLAVSVGA